MTPDPGDPADSIEIDVTLETEAWHAALPDAEARTARAAMAALHGACPDLAAAALGVMLADDATLQALNRTWRGKDKPTNVLSFATTPTRPGEVPLAEFAGVPLLLGDIAIAFETVAAEAAGQGKTIAHHLDHLTVHGVLHLLGYDHESEADAAIMEELEVAILGRLGVPDPYAGERLHG
jgi:probable rRNA maturation factor